MAQIGGGNRRGGGDGRGLEQVSPRDTGAWHGVLRVGPAVGRVLFWFGMKATSSALPGLARISPIRPLRDFAEAARTVCQAHVSRGSSIAGRSSASIRCRLLTVRKN